MFSIHITVGWRVISSGTVFTLTRRGVLEKVILIVLVSCHSKLAFDLWTVITEAASLPEGREGVL